MITEKERDTLNLIRWISTISIVACHLLQGYGSIYAWIFNIGVQVFFFLSGFLYGNKRITKTLSFYRKRLIKLYLPYIIWVIIAASCLYFSSGANSINEIAIFKQLFMLKNLPGLNHLWFMRVIFLCYLILPLIDSSLNHKNNITIIALVLLLFIMIFFYYSSSLLWILTYYVGYICGRYPKIQSFLWIGSAIIVLCIIGWTHCDINIFKEPSIKNDLLHTFGGIFLFLLIFKTVQHVKFDNRIRKLLNKGGAYEIYLTHHFFYTWTSLFIVRYTFIINQCIDCYYYHIIQLILAQKNYANDSKYKSLHSQTYDLKIIIL